MTRLLGVLAALVLVLAPTPASAEPNDVMTATLVRHGQTQANVDGIVDTAIPGAPLTPLGETQAKAAAQRLAPNEYDAVFASPLLRTRQTAQYLADELGQPVRIDDGLREVEGGDAEGRPGEEAVGMLDAITAWMQGDRSARIPGSIDGNELDARFDSALQDIAAGGYTNPVVFSHGAAIMAWTMMNVDNPPAKAPGLDNTGYVVVRGNPNTGWTLVDWVPQP